MGAKRVPLFGGSFALVDSIDFDRVVKFKWYLQKGRYTFYATCTNKRHLGNKSLLLHRVVMDAPPGTEVDHRNRNGLDCRRKNLLVTTRRGNSLNSKTPVNSTSGIKGVTWAKHANRWYAHITIDGRMTYLGYFSDKKVAARVVGKKREELIRKESLRGIGR